MLEENLWADHKIKNRTNYEKRQRSREREMEKNRFRELNMYESFNEYIVPNLNIHNPISYEVA
ncbi:hypothetical protein KY334_02065 [Candidatus Woesearchaeota archaeon]|nr:hypothetical protein [Candidatus Woesearchaeota archaeon]